MHHSGERNRAERDRQPKAALRVCAAAQSNRPACCFRRLPRWGLISKAIYRFAENPVSLTPFSLRLEQLIVLAVQLRTSIGRAAQWCRPAACAPRSLCLSLHCVWSVFLFLNLAIATGATNADTFSSVVSYQYQNALNEPGSQTTITSPIVSYQYFDWPGDENLTFQNSLPVSYQYDGIPQIVTQPFTKNFPAGSSLTLSVTATGTAPLQYQWRVNGMDLQGGTTATYTVANAQPVHSGSYSVEVRNSVGKVTSQDAPVTVYNQPLTPKPGLPLFDFVESRPDLSFLAPLLNTQGLRVFNPATSYFEPISAISYRRDIMAIVLTHGLASHSGTFGDVRWPLSMARTLAATRAPDGKLYSEKAHILAWDWKDNANESLWHVGRAAGRTPTEGNQLGKALLNMFGGSYNQKIHFIGHSLGTMVNCAAADFIHNSRRPAADRLLPVYNYANTHVTLLDEAEIANAVSPVWMGYFQTRLDADATDAEQVRSLHQKVIPTRAAYVDSYSSLVAAAHPNVANAFLWRRLLVPVSSSVELPVYRALLLNPLNLVEVHGYAYEWYQESIKQPTANPYMGHRFSFERDTIGPISQLSTHYVQSTNLLQSPLALNPISNLASGSPMVLYPGYEFYKKLNTARKVVQGRYLQLQTTGKVVANFVSTYISPPGTPVYSGTANSTPQRILPPGTESSSADWYLNVTMRAGTQEPQVLTSGPRSLSVQSVSATADASNSVLTILPINVPKEAVSMTFEYQVSGAGDDEYVSLAIAGEEEYTMETKYLDDSQWNRSPPINVADLSGSDVEFVYAISGSSALPVGALSVRNIAFYIPPRPELTLAITGNEMKVSWPVSAVGWTIEGTNDLRGTWQAIDGVPEISNFEHSLIFDLSTGSKAYFRLRK